MRAVVLVLVSLLLLPLHTVRAQDLSTPPASASFVPAPTAPGTVTASVKAFESRVLAHPGEGGRDRGRGALYGFAIGALVGGVGFAAANYAFTDSTPRDEYTLLSFLLGAAVGGATGAVAGAIIGAPGREEVWPQQVRLHVSPELSGRGTVAASLSFGFR